DHDEASAGRHASNNKSGRNEGEFSRGRNEGEFSRGSNFMANCCCMTIGDKIGTGTQADTGSAKSGPVKDGPGSSRGPDKTGATDVAKKDTRAKEVASKSKGNNGVGNGLDPHPPGNPPVNDGSGTSPGSPGNKGGVKTATGPDKTGTTDVSKKETKSTPVV